MSATERFDRDFADLLSELAESRTPDYFPEVLERAVSVKQRPAWTFPERWFPMGVLARGASLRPALPWRMVALLALLLAVLLATVIIGVGALLLQSRPAPPFGLAANGVLAYSHEGDIYSRDPANGESRLLVGGADFDVGPVFSSDGTTLTFIRVLQTEPREIVAVMAANADGSNLRTLVEPEPAGELHWSSLSPDGRHLILANSSEESPGLSVVNIADGSRTALDVGVEAQSVEWLPDSSEIVFRGIDGRDAALYAIRPDGSNLRRLTESIPGTAYDIVLSISHDGRFVGYNSRVGSIHSFNILDLQTGEHVVQLPPIGGHEGHPVFSPDNQNVAFIRYTPEAQAYVGPIEGKSSDATPIGPKVRLPDYHRGLFQQFSPDGKSLLIVSEEGQVWLADVATGEYREITWDRDADEVHMGWQRRAP